MKKILIPMLIVFMLMNACGLPAAVTTPPPVSPAGATPTGTTLPGETGMPTSTPILPTATATIIPTATPVLPAPISPENFDQLSVTRVYTDVIDAAVFEDFGIEPGRYSAYARTISPDGRYIAVGGCTSLASGTCYDDVYPGHAFLYILDAVTAQIISRIPVDGKDVRNLAFNPDGSRLVYVLCPHEGAVWDVNQNTVEYVFWQERGCQTSPRVTVSPDGNKIVLASGAYLSIFDLNSGNQVDQVSTNGGWAALPKYSMDGRYMLFFKSDDGHIITIYDTTNWEVVSQIQITDGETDTYLVDISPDGRWIASANLGYEIDIQIWNAASGEKVAVLDEPLPIINTVVFSPDGQLLLVSGFNDKTGSTQVMSIWDMETREWLGAVSGTMPPSRITFTRDGTAFLAGYDFGGPALWSLPDKELLAARKAVTGMLDALAAGDYQAAAAWYQPSAEEQSVLQSHGFDPTDLTGTLEGICAQEHQPCMPIHQILFGEKASQTEYQFTMNFTAPDGSIYQSPNDETVFGAFVTTQPDGSMRVTYLPYFFLNP